MTHPTAHIHEDAAEPRHLASQTAHVIEELQLFGHHPNEDEPDPRPLPEGDLLEGAVTDLFDILAGAFRDTRLEADTGDLLWSLTDLFHKKASRVQRQLDENEDKQRASQSEQDGSEVKSVELERLIAQGQTILEKRAVFETIRDLAAERFEIETGSAWRPRAGSLVNHKTMTAAMLDSRDFIAARRRAETELHLPAGPKIAFAGGTGCNDHIRIWAVLDKALAKHPDMVLILGGSPKGAEKAAACWADNRKVAQIAFKPEWTRDGKAAPFKRNDRILEIVPIGLIVFPGSGITDNLADKAKKRIRYGDATAVVQAAIRWSCAGAPRAAFQFQGSSSTS